MKYNEKLIERVRDFLIHESSTHLSMCFGKDGKPVHNETTQELLDYAGSANSLISLIDTLNVAPEVNACNSN